MYSGDLKKLFLRGALFVVLILSLSYNFLLFIERDIILQELAFLKNNDIKKPRFYSKKIEREALQSLKEIETYKKTQ